MGFVCLCACMMKSAVKFEIGDILMHLLHAYLHTQYIPAWASCECLYDAVMDVKQIKLNPVNQSQVGLAISSVRFLKELCITFVESGVGTLQ